MSSSSTRSRQLHVGLRIGRNSDPNSILARNATYHAICQLANYYGYIVGQRNGQRYFGPPIGATSVPSKDCEVFLGSIPQNIFEDTLVPLLRRVGNLFQLRLMLDFSGSNRGFAFALFESPEDAVNACCLLNNYEIIPGRRIVCIPCQDNNCLYLGGISNKEPLEIMNIIFMITPEVKLAFVTIPDSKGRRYVMLTFNSHREAALARRKYLVMNFELWGMSQHVIVDWKNRHQIRFPFNAVGRISRDHLLLCPRVFKYLHNNGFLYITYN